MMSHRQTQTKTDFSAGRLGQLKNRPDFGEVLGPEVALARDVKSLHQDDHPYGWCGSVVKKSSGGQ
jgi:hypothetical protein